MCWVPQPKALKPTMEPHARCALKGDRRHHWHTDTQSLDDILPLQILMIAQIFFQSSPREAVGIEKVSRRRRPKWCSACARYCTSRRKVRRCRSEVVLAVWQRANSNQQQELKEIDLVEIMNENHAHVWMRAYRQRHRRAIAALSRLVASRCSR